MISDIFKGGGGGGGSCAVTRLSNQWEPVKDFLIWFVKKITIWKIIKENIKKLTGENNLINNFKKFKQL